MSTPTTVYFATNRNPILKDGKIIDFGKGFSAEGTSDLRFGQALVDIDENSFSMEIAPNLPAEGSAAIYTNVKKKMRDQSRSTLIMIHGYATSFAQAIMGAAKTKKAYGQANLNVFMFSWPSDGKNFPPQAYADDRHDAKTSGLAFARGIMKLIDFLSEGDPCGQKVHLLSHSMGNYVLRHAVQAMIQQTNGSLPRIFENIFSMAADEDYDAFDPMPGKDGAKEPKWERLPELARQVHVYFNNHDHALNVSSSPIGKGNPDRMGSDGPAKPMNLPSKVTLIDVSNTDRFLLDAIGHGYYDSQEKVVADVLQVIAGAEARKIPGREYDPARNRYLIKA